MAFDSHNNGAVGMPEDDSGIPLPFVEDEVAQAQPNSGEVMQMLQGQNHQSLEQDAAAPADGANAGDVAHAFGENADSREGARNEEENSGSPPPSSDADDPSSAAGADGQRSPPQEPDKELQMRKLFVGGLSRSTTTDSLRTYFQQYGDVADSEVLFDKFTGRSRGFGFITFTTPDPVARVADMRHTVDGTQ
ncbi:RNA recognition motif-containing protein, partial [Toxoplasma gondii GAB2-2007-GAL-DOM2]